MLMLPPLPFFGQYDPTGNSVVWTDVGSCRHSPHYTDIRTKLIIIFQFYGVRYPSEMISGMLEATEVISR